MIHTPPCPLCRSETHPFFGNADALLECRECGVVIDTRVTVNKETYESLVTSWKDRERIQSRKRDARQRIALARKYLHKSHSMLEIGCAGCYFLDEVKGLVNSVKGIEPSAFYSDYAQKELKLDVKQSGIEDASFPPASFDVVALFSVFEHLVDPIGALKKIHEWLKPKGFLILEMPNIQCPSARHKGINWMHIHDEHRFHFGPGSIEKLLNRYGFEIVSIRSRDFNQYRIGIGKSIRKLFLSLPSHNATAIASKGNKKASETQKSSPSRLKKMRKALQLPVTALLGWLVLKFNKGDNLFVIARKKPA